MRGQSDGWAPELQTPPRPPLVVQEPAPSAEEVLAVLRQSPSLFQPIDEGVTRIDAALPGPALDRDPTYNPHCVECCQRQRCHWCAAKPGPILLCAADVAGYAYHACHAHADLFESFADIPRAAYVCEPYAVVGLNAPVRLEGSTTVRPRFS